MRLIVDLRPALLDAPEHDVFIKRILTEMDMVPVLHTRWSSMLWKLHTLSSTPTKFQMRI
jgi:hypothetical protein